MISPVMLVFFLCSLLLLTGVQWLPGCCVCVCDRVHGQQGAYMDRYAHPCSLCSWHHGGGSDGLPGPSLVDLPDHPLHMHLTLFAVLLEVPRDAFLFNGQGPLSRDSGPPGHNSPIQRT